MKKEDYHKYHKELWDWLAENPAKGKKYWPGWTGWSDTYGGYFVDRFHRAGCFACSFCESRCRKCPLDWGIEYVDVFHDPCVDDSSPYQKWCDSTDPAERSRIAAIIRDLPWEDKE